MVFGELPADFIEGEPRNLSTVANHSEWWTVTLDQITYGSELILEPSETPRYAILDTGTSLLSLPEAEYLAFVNEIRQLDAFSCEQAYCYTFENTCDYYWEYMSDLEFWLDG